MTGKPPFETIVREHGPTVLRVCRAVVGGADADDAWSETFLSALRAYPELPVDANVEAWLVTIAHRRAIDITRRTARRPTPVASPSDIAGTPGTACTDAELGRGGLPPDSALAAALQRLPTKQRQAVAYHYLGGLPYADVADLIGGNTAAARRAAADGIATLRRTYAAAGAENGESDER